MKSLVGFLLFSSVLRSNSGAEDVYPGRTATIWDKIVDNIVPLTESLTGGLTMDVNQTCTMCHLGFDSLIQERRGGMTDLQIFAEINYFCSTYLDNADRVCQGLLPPQVAIFTYIVDKKTDIDGKKICGLFFQNIECDAGNNFEWTIKVPDGSTIEKTVSDRSESFKVLHLTDMHYDPNYSDSKKTSCDEPLCCQSDQPNDATGTADDCGYWGSYHKADSPLRLIEETLTQAKKSHDFDYVYFTGDMVAHRVWSTSIRNNTAAIEKIFDMFSEHFEVPVYPILGNHEAHPVNAYAAGDIAENVSTQWLYQLVLKKWSNWLPVEEVKETILRGGFYTVQAKTGFRIIVLNNNVCSTENWWLLYEDNDPYGQLKWLVEILEESERKKESVHILSHIPTNSCLKSWAREYNKIIERFANTITGQFFGHSHTDEFYIYYGSNNITKPTNVAWNGASVVADKANPNYKLYTIDSKNFDVLDTETWTFNLTKANLEKSVEWFSLYTMKEAYDLKSLDPSDMDDLVKRMAQNSTLINQYHKFHRRDSGVINSKCEKSCRDDHLCEIVNTIHGERRKCQELMNLKTKE